MSKRLAVATKKTPVSAMGYSDGILKRYWRNILSKIDKGGISQLTKSLFPGRARFSIFPICFYRDSERGGGAPVINDHNGAVRLVHYLSCR